MQVQREEKARTMLLTALPDEHMGDFYHMIDAKQIWIAIKARFGGNAKSTRMRRSILKHQFEEYKASKEEGLDGGYDKMQKILSKMNTLKIKPDQEDINIKFLRGLPPSWANICPNHEVPASALANAAFVSSSSSSSSRSKLSYQETNGGGSSAKHSTSKGSSSTKSSAIDDVIYSLIADYEEDQHFVFEDLDQVNKEAFDEYEIKHQMAMIAIKARKFEKKYGRPVQFDSREAARFNKKLAKCFKSKEASESSALVVIDGSQGVNWDKQIQENITKPGVLGNYGFVAEKGTNSTIPADDAVPADVVLASDFISAEPTILADRVIAAEASVLTVDGIHADSEKLLDQASDENQDLMAKLENEKSINTKWLSTSKNLHKLVDTSMTTRTKRGLGYVNLTGEDD
nr:ribonuclease H-like domain-containing protein [Tanacetum cinerariifolium]